MLAVTKTDTDLQLDSRHYLLPCLLLLLIPLLLYEFGPALLRGELDRSNLVGLALGIGLPVFFAFFFIEFGHFRLSLADGVFSWRWRNLLGREQGEVELKRVTGVRRETLETSDRLGWQNLHRLIMVLDDGREIGLTHGYTTIQQRRMDEIIEQIRDYLEYVTPVR